MCFSTSLGLFLSHVLLKNDYEEKIKVLLNDICGLFTGHRLIKVNHLVLKTIV